MRMLFKRYPFWSFYVVALLLAVIGNVIIFFGLPGNPLDLFKLTITALHLNHFNVIVPLYLIGQYPALFLGMVFPLAPTLSGILVSAINHGNGAVVVLLAKLKPLVGNISPRDGVVVYIILISVVATVYVGAIGLTYGFDDIEKYSKVAALAEVATPSLFLGYFFMALCLDTGGLCEELGWRGYAWPLLMQRMRTPLVAAIALGIAWGFWHIPREIPPLILGAPMIPFLLGQFVFVFNLIIVTIVACYFVNRAGGSIWPAVIVHGSFNYCFAMMPQQGAGIIFVPAGVAIGAFTYANLLTLVVAAIIVWHAGPNLGKPTSACQHEH